MKQSFDRCPRQIDVRVFQLLLMSLAPKPYPAQVWLLSFNGLDACFLSSLGLALGAFLRRCLPIVALIVML